MVDKVTLTNLVNLQNETTAINTINNNNVAITAAMDNTLSRDGTSPNQMGANLDMNSNRILNLPSAVSTTEPVTLSQMTSALAANGNIVTGVTGVPVSAPMQPVVNAASISAAETLLGISTAMQPVLASSTTSAAANLLGISPAMQAVTSATTTAAAAAILGVTSTITPEQYGAVGDGIHDDTLSLQNAINAAGNSSKVLILGAKTYKTTSGLTDTVGIKFQGAGSFATKISFQPTANGTCLTVANGASSIAQGGIYDMEFYSPDQTFTKTGIVLQDVRNGYELSNIKFSGNAVAGSNCWSGGTGSIGLQTKGREMLSTNNIWIFADLPLKISVNPNLSPSLADLFNFHNTALYSPSTNPCVTIDPGVLTRISFTGFLWCGGGGSGIQWIDTTTATASQGLFIENFGSEQGFNAASYSIDIESNGLYNFTLVNAVLDPGRKGIKLRRTVNANLTSVLFVASSESINADSSVQSLVWDSCFGIAPTITGLTQIFASSPVSSGMPARAIYSSVSGAGMSMVMPFGTVAGLPPAAGNQGRITMVSDANATMAAGSGATVAGGGSNVVPVFSDGANWRIM